MDEKELAPHERKYKSIWYKKHMQEQEILQALELINSGKWRQMEGGAGRSAQQFIDSGEIVVDVERTEKEGPVSFVDGYGVSRQQPYFEIDWDRFNEVSPERLVEQYYPKPRKDFK
tara:strand:+ start:186 stop:533 length:348 start_codon:yes stop_codon:yes gene_type:complete